MCIEACRIAGVYRLAIIDTSLLVLCLDRWSPCRQNIMCYSRIRIVVHALLSPTWRAAAVQKLPAHLNMAERRAPSTRRGASETEYNACDNEHKKLIDHGRLNEGCVWHLPPITSHATQAGYRKKRKESRLLLAQKFAK